jgi:Leucine-rich repeat (LRR) protein
MTDIWFSDITDYLNSLDSAVTEIYISHRHLTELPNLSRFNNLEKLYCSNNNLIVLPALNDSLTHLYCSSNNLTSLPPLNDKLTHLYCSNNNLTSLPSLNDKLTYLHCTNNQLTSLPPLNDKLTHLYCSFNQLTSLPRLNDNLIVLYCSNNQLTSLPPSNSLRQLYCQDNKLISLPALNIKTNIWCYSNPINEIIGSITNVKNTKWNHFREFYFLSKLQKKFISWMWKSRESKIREQYHPKHLHHFLENNNISENDYEAIDKFLIQW